jgi:hypothetical protein
MERGFARGHLYISRKPSPRLLAQEDPFHPSNKPLWVWDSTLYDGHFYFYWGPVPALLTWAFKSVTGFTGKISDQTLTLLFMLGRLYAGAALILGLGRSIRMRQPPWIVGLAIAVFGLTSPIPFIMARPLVYEACLAAGQCFLFGGLLMAFWGLVDRSRRTLKFLIAGVSWALAIGSRITMSIPIPVIVLITLGLIWFSGERSWRKLVAPSMALGAPVATALACYAIYNYARFGSVSEFGVTWQLTTQKFVTSDVFVIPNIFSYLFAPADWSCHFPFVKAVPRRPLSPWIEWPEGYYTFELVAGIMTLSAWCWLALVALWRPVARVWVSLTQRDAAATPTISIPELWAGSCSLAILFSMVPVLGLWEASMRYTGDAIGGVIIASTLAAFWLLRRADASPRPLTRLAVRAMLVILGLHSCVLGGLSGVASYGAPFERHNPELYESLRQTLSLCGGGS